MIDGSQGWLFRLTPATAAGLFKLSPKDETPVRVLRWVPRVVRFLVTLADDGQINGRYYELDVADHVAVTSWDDLRKGECWQRWPHARGTATRAVREALANMVEEQTDGMTYTVASVRTGWHTTPEGGRMYVHPTGRCWPADRSAYVVGAPAKLVAAAAGPESLPDGAEIRRAWTEVVTHAGPAALVALATAARSFGQSFTPVPSALVLEGDPHSGKTSAGAAGRLLVVTYCWPPVATTAFSATATSMEAKINFEADMPTLIDDLALTADASRAENADAVKKLEAIIRSVANGEEIRGRMNRDAVTMKDSRYVRSIPVITAQRLPASMQASLWRRSVVVRVERERGDVNYAWWKENAADVAPGLRALGERIIARLGSAEDPAEILAGARATALAALGAHVDRVLPDWQTSVDGMTGVVENAASMLSGLVLLAEAAGVEHGPTLDYAAAYLAGALSVQAERMSDRRAATDDLAVAVADTIRRALLDRRAHVRNPAGEMGPGGGPESLTPQALGYRESGGLGGGPLWEGNGAALYWRPERGAAGALGIASRDLHDLLRSGGDPRCAGYTPRSIPAALRRAGALVETGQTSSADTVQERVGAEKLRLVMLDSRVIWPDLAGPADSGPQEGGQLPEPAPAAPPAPAPTDPPANPSPSTEGRIDPAPCVACGQDAVWSKGGLPLHVGCDAPAPAPAAPVPGVQEELPAAETGPALALAADLDGIYLGDGRALDPGDALQNVGAFLDQAVKLMAGEGSVAITAELAAALGYPDAPPARETFAQADRRKRAVKATPPAEPRAVVDGRAAGWLPADSGVQPWTTWRHPATGARVHVLVIEWSGHGVSGSHLLVTPDLTAPEAALRLESWRAATGHPYVMTAGITGCNMLAEGKHFGRAALRKWTPPTDAPTGTEKGFGPARPYAEWTPEEQSAPVVIGFDMRKAYLAGLAGAYLAMDRLEHTGVETGFDKTRAGYWEISGAWTVPGCPWADLRGYRPGLKPGPSWVATPVVAELIALGMPEEMITDAWLSPRSTGHSARIGRATAETLRDALAELGDPGADPDRAALRDALKAAYRETYGQIQRSTGSVFRQDWADTIAAYCRASMIRSVVRIGKATGRWPVELDVDCAYYTATGPDDNPGFDLTDRIGRFAVKSVQATADYRAARER